MVYVGIKKSNCYISFVSYGFSNISGIAASSVLIRISGGYERGYI
jgi:hypothetical protein